MKGIKVFVGIALILITGYANLQAQTLPLKQDVLNDIYKANNYWQTNYEPQQRSFWDHAAYQTGNMEVVALTNNETYRIC